MIHKLDLNPSVKIQGDFIIFIQKGKIMPQEKNNIDEVLDFCVNLSRKMIVSGANLERVRLAVEFISRAYNLRDLSIYLLSTHISLSAYDSERRYASRQASIPPAGINLNRLRSLNQLSYRVSEVTPPTKLLTQMLERASQVSEYNSMIILIGKICAVICLCFMFGGSLNEIIPVAFVVALIHFMMQILEKTGLDRLVINSLTMFTATSLAILFVYSGFNDNLPAVIIGVSLLVIPGIPLVNAMRNLLCGSEINGILQMLKIFVDTMALGMGIYVAVTLFGGEAMMQGANLTSPNPSVMVILSFIASVSFGVVFNIPLKDLWLAGLGGALARVALLTLTPLVSGRLVYMTLSASAAALYAEILAIKRRQPSTYFVYPSIIPLIPGDLFFFSLSSLYLSNISGFIDNGVNCLISLSGLSIGFVLSFTVSHYARRIRYEA